MHNKRVSINSARGAAALPPLIVFSAFFICGCVVGGVSSGHLISYSYSGDASAVLGLRSGLGASGLPAAFLASAKYHLAVLLLAFTLPGFFLIPLVFGVRGFFLAFGVATAARCIGAEYPAAVLLAYLPSLLVSLPCLYILSVHGLSASRQLAGCLTGRRPAAAAPYGGGFLIAAALTLLVMLLLSAFELYLLPRMLAALFPALFQIPAG